MGDRSITFRAAFPTIMSAIRITGNRDGMRIQLDIPESEMATAANLLLWRERVLVVTVEPESESDRTKSRKINI
jgi:hypothetical protein